MDVGGGVCLQRRHDHRVDIVGRQALRLQDVLRTLLFGADNLGFRKAEKLEPPFIQLGQVLRWSGVNQDVVATAAYQVENDVHLLAGVPALHPVHFRTWDPERSRIERLYGVGHFSSPSFGWISSGTVSITDCLKIRIPLRN